jgi:hypothetical protein
MIFVIIPLVLAKLESASFDNNHLLSDAAFQALLAVDRAVSFPMTFHSCESYPSQTFSQFCNFVATILAFSARRVILAVNPEGEALPLFLLF